jgi:hypothetical protein
MPQSSQKSDTTANMTAKYSRATLVEIAKPTRTTAVLPDLRTAVTKRMQGTIELRYTPCEPPPATTTTASP